MATSSIASRGSHATNVLRRAAVGSAERAAMEPAADRLRWRAALRRLDLVRRHRQPLEDARRRKCRSARTIRSACRRFGAPMSAAFTQRANLPANCMSGGFSSARSARRFAPMVEPGICGGRGVGTPARSVRASITEDPDPNELHNPQSSRFAANIWSFAINCCPTTTRCAARRTTRDCR